jgi:hypothetical protein
MSNTATQLKGTKLEWGTPSGANLDVTAFIDGGDPNNVIVSAGAVNFTNKLSAKTIEATTEVKAPNLRGTATNALALKNPVKLHIEGDAEGVVNNVDFSSDVFLNVKVKHADAASILSVPQVVVFAGDLEGTVSIGTSTQDIVCNVQVISDSHDHNLAYYTKVLSDSNYINKKGNDITVGNITIQKPTPIIKTKATANGYGGLIAEGNVANVAFNFIQVDDGSAASPAIGYIGMGSLPATGKPSLAALQFTSANNSTKVLGHMVGEAANSITGFGKIENSTWRDYADSVDIDEKTIISPGSVYIIDNTGTVKLSQKYAQKGTIGICTDTYGMRLGEMESNRTLPIAVAGFVLAHTNVYPAGTPLVSGVNGVLKKASVITRIFFPERILGTFFKSEPQEKWNGIIVANRHWVKVR